MSFIYEQGLAEVLVAASSKITIGCFNGTFKVSTWTVGNSNLPRSYTYVTTVTDGTYTSAAYSAATYVRIEMLAAGTCEYVTGAAPVLTNMPVNAASGLVLGYTDSSGTPGAASTTTPRGRAAIAASASSVVITNALCLATSTVLIAPKQVDSTLINWGVAPGAGSFTLTGNTTANATFIFDYVIIN